MQRLLIFLAGGNGALAVLALAVAAHGFQGDADDLARFTRAAEFQLWHALALVAMAALKNGTPRLTVFSAVALQLGILFFSGSLYWLGLGQSLGSLVWITPLGGTLLIAGWLFLALAGLFGRRGRA